MLDLLLFNPKSYIKIKSRFFNFEKIGNSNILAWDSAAELGPRVSYPTKGGNPKFLNLEF